LKTFYGFTQLAKKFDKKRISKKSINIYYVLVVFSKIYVFEMNDQHNFYKKIGKIL